LKGLGNGKALSVKAVPEAIPIIELSLMYIYILNEKTEFFPMNLI
jgi:hypothetical protein